ncbi:tripartite tricarboxylate transporter permease [Providencia vermicola]|uniref:Tripartite tricarboxylate transporter permease n=2 Tax=Enterobacterales TaxID=91347 RepID=A0AAI9HWR0_PROST|nr:MULTISPECIES: tripartite tricarboxylate transporter permease [Providencia]ELR5043809.1 tripartite tricarboxylate transporter permease [Providencia rettgeri]ELR5034124.1 tripartite tricarboxylate transporter permease [Providencia stuartii]ELR5119512.1 tripartite tricarboxylate transporter permease [Providencia stuartii]ELR5290612.1 tripartite tricarboxylate transporter permease [Providencia stuartii]ELZ5938287.1 tripartite tricarboxylate transporter permease [Providencia stuartii]
METWMYLSQGFEVALIPQNLLIALIGCFIGTVVGMLPGLGPINGVAILLPLAFALKLPAESALILLATVYLGCEYGGRISSILLNVPGDAAAIMTTLDGYPMAKQGKGGVALSISAVSSFIGSTIAIFGIILFAPLLAQWALAFGPAEYFALMVFAIACLGSMMSQNPIKSLLAALIGLAFATVGVDANSGEYRFTFGSVNLSDGIQFIVVVIGLFSVSEILLMLEGTATGQGLIRKTGRMLFNRKEAKACAGPTLRSSLVGFFVGVLPGAGATIASAITYMTEKKISGANGQFGNGDVRGVAAPEAANNASACGSFIPMLTLGVPGSGTTAVMMGALTLYNITPGPGMFTEQPDIVWGLIAALLIANIVLLVMNIPLIGLFTRMLTVPLWFLVPAIATVSAVGVYAVHSTTFDLLLMMGLGVFGYILRKMNFPLSPLILGFVLGEMLEQSLRRSLSISNGEFNILWNSPISQCLLVMAVLVLVLPPIVKLIRKKRQHQATTREHS